MFDPVKRCFNRVTKRTPLKPVKWQWCVKLNEAPLTHPSRGFANTFKAKGNGSAALLVEGCGIAHVATVLSMLLLLRLMRGWRRRWRGGRGRARWVQRGRPTGCWVQSGSAARPRFIGRPERIRRSYHTAQRIRRIGLQVLLFIALVPGVVGQEGGGRGGRRKAARLRGNGGSRRSNSWWRRIAVAVIVVALGAGGSRRHSRRRLRVFHKRILQIQRKVENGMSFVAPLLWESSTCHNAKTFAA